MVHKVLNEAPSSLLVNLGVHSPAPITVLMQHLKELTLIMDEEAVTLRGHILHSLKKIATYLKSHRNHATNQAIEELSGVPLVVLDNGQRVPCDHVCVDIEADVSDKARALPPVYAEVEKLLLTLGARRMLDGSAPRVKLTADNPTVSILSFIQDQLDQPAFSDLRIVVGKRTFYAHRVVMCATCEPLRNNFLFEQASSGMGIIGEQLPIYMPEWVDEASFSCLLRYLYKGKICREDGQNWELNEEAIEVVCGLLRLADYWQLDYVTEWCEAFFAEKSVLSVYNVCGLLTHSYNCHAEQLTAMCIHFARMQHSVVSQTDGWRDLPEELRNEVAGV